MATLLLRNTLSAALAAALVFSIVIFAGQDASAQEQQAPVQVRGIRFSLQNSPTGDRWYRAEVELMANNNPAGDEAPNSRWVDNIEVTLTVAFPVKAYGSDFTFYRASATLVSLQQRKNTSVYFYLPWEIVERDRISGSEPEYYAVEIRVNGDALPPQREHFSRNLGDIAAVQHFLTASLEGVSRTAGIMVPTYQSPFMGMENRRGSPSYIRNEEQ